MRNFILFLKKLHIYKKQELLEAFNSFSKKKTILFLLFVFVALVSAISLLFKLNDKISVIIPAEGGKISEGIVGMPTLVNPVLAITDADKDLTSLVYSGLMRKDENGILIPDLAESYTVSPDGTTYTFIIRKDARFHNGDEVTADDVIFTIDKIKNSAIKSPRVANWEGVMVSKNDETTVTFSLSAPYISFMDNTTIGILPSKVWDNVDDRDFAISPLNIKAIGSGPYKIKSVSKNKDGIPVRYELERFRKFVSGTPYIKNLSIISFSSEKELVKALIAGSIDQAGGISPSNVVNIKENKFKINTATLPRIFGLFINSNKNKIFTDSNVVRAFDLALNRQDIIDQVLSGYGDTIHNPIPETLKGEDIKEYEFSIDKANEILEKNGWILREDGFRYKGGTSVVEKTKTVKGKKVTEKVKVNNGEEIKLAFSITTGDTPELRKTSLIIKEQFKKIGADVNTDKVYESGQLNQLIKDRDYETLLFGQIVNHESDLYSFWHSSQRVSPGLNIAMYSNSKVDTLLESIQKSLNQEDRIKKYQELEKEFDNNIPALLIYSPKYIYITSTELGDLNLNTIITPADRFSSIHNWYKEKDRVWKIFQTFIDKK